MSIRALRYITGDTQQSGFRCIGSSDSFPADDLPWLNNGSPISERARVEPRGNRSAGGDIQTLAHVWEYQTGKFGTPVIINTYGAIGTGRAHCFSEYVAGKTENVAALAEPGPMISSAEAFQALDVETFMNIPGKEMVDCPEMDWAPETVGQPEAFDIGLDEVWKLTVLSHYWKQASVRAFSEDSPSSVRVCLGEFDENDPMADTEETIRRAKRFFADVVVSGLPRQVQNIASFAAGVNCGDTNTLYTALEVDVTRNMYEEDTLQLRHPRELRSYRLTEAEMDFIREVSAGNVPEVVQSCFDRYRELTERTSLTELDVPFMSDYRVWYALYCMARIPAEKHAFIERAGLMNEHGNPKKVRDARACFTLMRQLRYLLEDEHRLNSERRTLVTELIGPLETAVLKVMLEEMSSDSAEPFLLRRNDMVDFHRKTLYTATEDQLPTMIELSVRDAEVSSAPQFVRCYPATPLRNENVDARNGQLLSALLPRVIRPLIDAETKKEKIENKYLLALKEPDFADNWANLNQNEKTRAAVLSFLQEEIQNPQKHFLLYGISRKYLPINELLRMTFRHFTAGHATPAAQPDARQMKIAMDGRNYLVDRPDPDCLSDMNRYYQACFREYRGNIGQISGIIGQLGGDTTEAMVRIFEEAGNGKQLEQSEAEAVFTTFGGEGNRLAKGEAVQQAFRNMITAQRDRFLDESPERRSSLVQWIGKMLQTAPFEVDTSEDMVCLFRQATDGERFTSDEIAGIFSELDPGNQYARKDQVGEAYLNMIAVQRDRMLQDNSQDRESSREALVRWIAVMADKAPFEVDTSDSIRAIFEDAKTGERMNRSSVEDVFQRLIPSSRATDEKVKPAFTAMIREQLDTALSQKDQSAVEWIGNMISASAGSIDFDTTDSLKKIFEAAKTGERMRPADAGVAFSTMGSHASGLHSTVQRAYSEMLSVRRKESLDDADPDGFGWLCDMADRSPWSQNTDWVSEQHTENLSMLCDLCDKTERAADNTFLSMIQTWVNEGKLTPKGMGKLQKYCDDWLKKGNETAADMFLSHFGRLDESCSALRDRVVEKARDMLREGLQKEDVQFGTLLEDCRREVDRAGKTLDDLYRETAEETDAFLDRHFENESSLNNLVAETDQIPKNCEFSRQWDQRLRTRIDNQQVELFNRQPNLEKLMELKRSIMARSTLVPQLQAAYKLLESYEDRLEQLKEKTEYEAVTGMGSELSEIARLLGNASDVRKTLCSSLRNINWPALEELRKKSFRHALCGSMMQAILTDTEHKDVRGCPDWNKVLNSLFSKAELDKVSRKPYAPNHLCILQRLMATVENVRLMTAYNMDDTWAAELIKAIHGHPDLREYQSALGRNRKQSEQYRLAFDADGLRFDLDKE